MKRQSTDGGTGQTWARTPKQPRSPHIPAVLTLILMVTFRWTCSVCWCGVAPHADLWVQQHAGPSVNLVWTQQRPPKSRLEESRGECKRAVQILICFLGQNSCSWWFYVIVKHQREHAEGKQLSSSSFSEKKHLLMLNKYNQVATDSPWNHWFLLNIFLFHSFHHERSKLASLVALSFTNCSWLIHKVYNHLLTLHHLAPTSSHPGPRNPGETICSSSTDHKRLHLLYQSLDIAVPWLTTRGFSSSIDR